MSDPHRNEDVPTRPALGESGMVSAAHPLAALAGCDVLATGGNAFDAAVAVAATLNVVEPMMSGIGGYGTILTHHAPTDETCFLNASGRMPLALDSDAFRPPTSDYLANRKGAMAISTPGNLHAWQALAERYGQLEWPRLFDAAIRAAEEGFVVSRTLAQHTAAKFADFAEHARRIYGREGQPLPAGERLVQKDLARSLRLIAEQGAGVLYGGQLGAAIAATVQEAGGFLSLDDLRHDRAEWWPPISIDCLDHRIVTASPPANAFDMLVRLGMMSCFDLAALGHNTAAYLHRYAEVTRHGFWVRLRYAGDPEVNPPPLEKLLSPAYWAEQVAEIDPQQARPFRPPQAFGESGGHTTHFVVADRWGNVVSATQTIGELYGSRIMAPGTGIWLNNSLQYCTFEPPGNPMDAFAGRHKLSGDCPALVLRHGKPWAAIGTPGGHTIGQTVPQMVLNLLVFDMDIQQAIAAPRISFAEPDVLEAEEGIPASVRDELAALGHNIRLPKIPLGNAHGLTIEYDATGKPVRFTGAADPRGEGLARGC